MKTILLILFFGGLSFELDILGTYSYCCFNCYELVLKNRNEFTLIDKHGEWDVTRISEGKFKIVNDTLFLQEETKKFESKMRLDTANDKLNSYKFQILNNGELKTDCFFDCHPNPTQKEYWYFKKK